VETRSTEIGWSDGNRCWSARLTTRIRWDRVGCNASHRQFTAAVHWDHSQYLSRELVVMEVAHCPKCFCGHLERPYMPPTVPLGSFRKRNIGQLRTYNLTVYPHVCCVWITPTGASQLDLPAKPRAAANCEFKHRNTKQTARCALRARLMHTALRTPCRTWSRAAARAPPRSWYKTTVLCQARVQVTRPDWQPPPIPMPRAAL
jgi:hypothetical protein